jgi:AAA+ ATPase superfamily predicted ATPase
MINPFTLRVIPPNASFCNRKMELRDLRQHAINRANVVIFSPRRYGKTSLVKKLQADIAREGFLTFYVDLFMVTSIDEVARRIARNVYTVLHQRESLLAKGARLLKTFSTFRPVFKPSAENGFTLSVEPISPSMPGMEMLDKVMEELGLFIERERPDLHFVLDEFQEITELKQPAIEGIFRKHIQHHQASYFFVGSRRRVLLDIFNQRNRPFYQSAIMYPLDGLPHQELAAFIQEGFAGQGKACTMALAETISKQTFQHPYYAQALAYNVFDLCGEQVEAQDIETAFERMLASERYAYEAMIQGLTGAQISLLRALAVLPTAKMLSSDYLARHRLTVGGVQYAQKKLLELDLIEKRSGVWQVVDPIFARWLSRY